MPSICLNKCSYIMNSFSGKCTVGSRSLSLILDIHKQQVCYIRKGQIIQTIFHFQRDSNCLSSSAQVVHSGHKCLWADLLSPVKLLATVEADRHPFWIVETSGKIAFFFFSEKGCNFVVDRKSRPLQKSFIEFSKLESL